MAQYTIHAKIILRLIEYFCNKGSQVQFYVSACTLIVLWAGIINASHCWCHAKMDPEVECIEEIETQQSHLENSRCSLISRDGNLLAFLLPHFIVSLW
jgi:hypothetical protein